MSVQKWILLQFFLFSGPLSFSQQGDIVIVTHSTDDYAKQLEASIYPGFADGMPYQSWTKNGSIPYYQLEARSIHKPFKWKTVKGSLPDGMKLTEDGKLLGTPLRKGRFSFTVNVTDSKGNSSSKPLVFTIESPRSQWLTDAKFGVWFPLGPFMPPVFQTKEEIEEFERRLTKFDADKWAEAVAAIGGKVLNVSAKAGDGVRMWPSTTPSVHQLKIKRNIIKELVVACHKRDIKLVASFAPDHTWNKKINDTAIDGSWGTLNKGLIKELIEMGVDGFWIDMGGTPELFPKHVDPRWFPWKEILAMARSLNPKIIFSNNPGLEYGGAVLRWPDTDVLVYEGYTGLTENSLVVAKPAIVKKKVAIEANNLLDSSWSWGRKSSPKPANMIIKNIKANWDAGATYMLVIPVSPDGDIYNKTYAPVLSKIGTFVRRHQNLSKVPIPSLDKRVVYSSPKLLSLHAESKSKIFYTTDGSQPTSKSKVYTSPIKIAKTTQIKAVSIESGKEASKVLDETFFLKPATSDSKLYEQIIVGKKSDSKAITDSKSYYRGMKVVIGSDPVIINQIGRQHVTSNKNAHSVLIKTFTDNNPVCISEIDTKSAKVEADGFQYVTIPPTTLKPGVAYIIVSKEDSSDLFIPNSLDEKPKGDHYRIANHAILNATGDPHPTSQDGIGTLLNLKYQLGQKNEKKNLALGAIVSFVGTKDNPLPPWMGRYYVENAVDNDLSTRAQPGGEYAWSLKLDLGSVQKGVKQVVVDFASDGYATEFQLLSSIDGHKWNVIREKIENSNLHIDLNFPPVDLRYLKFRAVKPDGPGQKGHGMGILELKIF